MTIPFHQQLVALPPLGAAQGAQQPGHAAAPGPDQTDTAHPKNQPDNHPESHCTLGRQSQPHLLTPQRQAAFALALAEHGNVRLAARAVGVSPQTVYRARRQSYAFRRCWDAALAIAREAVEQVLADRAVHGVQESVFYHGEEVATRTRYDSRLLLAHLARLDRKVAEGGECEDCGALLLDEEHFDAAVEALARGEHEGEDEGAAEILPGQCSTCSTSAAEAERHRLANACPDCGGRCAEWQADPTVRLVQADCMWLGNRHDRMEAARPRGTPKPWDQPGGDPDGELAAIQLEAFEDGLERWWELTLEDLDEDFGGEGAGEGAQDAPGSGEA